MPEGDTVYQTAAALHRALAGQTILRAELRTPRHATARLAGMRVESVHSRGKHLLHRLVPCPATGGASTAGFVLHTALGMDGSWRLTPPGASWGVKAHRVRAVLETRMACAIGVNLPVLELAPREREAALLAHLGPDLLGEDWDEQRAARAIARYPNRQIAASLLDQRNLAGLGNEYVVELCFLLGVRPTAPVSAAGDPLRIVRLAHRLIVANRERVARTTTGNTRPGMRSWVHRREGAPCRRCGQMIIAGLHEAGARGGGVQAQGLQRRSWFCPRCQPLPATGA